MKKKSQQFCSMIQQSYNEYRDTDTGTDYYTRLHARHQVASSLTSPSSFAFLIANSWMGIMGSSTTASTWLAAGTDAVVSSLALAVESRRRTLERVDLRSGRVISSASSVGSRVIADSANSPVDSSSPDSSAPSDAAAPRVGRVRFAGYVASSSASLRLRFPLTPFTTPAPAAAAAPRRFLGLGFSLISSAAAAAMAPTFGSEGAGEALPSSPSRSTAVSRIFATGRRERADERRLASTMSSSMGVITGSGSGWPKWEGGNKGSDIARGPMGWYRGRGGSIGYRLRGTPLARTIMLGLETEDFEHEATGMGARLCESLDSGFVTPLALSADGD
ncbi:unnamed protein product [Mycena citricolor]|uniref:Uncharacterized protein n=1 Tax=Mycena citricolor TaxID=2018698 RepID=A0AAD2HIG1_9AGAR|nr:unnamed protein product [Mycena citricolor]